MHCEITVVWFNPAQRWELHYDDDGPDKGYLVRANYALGVGIWKHKGHYPVPATMDTAIYSVLHQWEYNRRWLVPLKLREMKNR